VKLFDVWPSATPGRSGGYCRVVKAGIRQSDAAPMANHRVRRPRRHRQGARTRSVMIDDEDDQLPPEALPLDTEGPLRTSRAALSFVPLL
jgi:large subunit ribosomal protein L17